MSVPVAITTLAALVGWGVAAAALRELLRARRRLEAVARAEHELRGPATVLLLACERMRRDPSARRHVWALEVELERMRRALAALTAARRGRDAAPVAGEASGERPLNEDPVVASEDPPPAGRSARAAGDLERLVGGALAGWEPSLRAAGRPLRFRWDAGRVGLPAHRSALASALANMVSNAAEHGAGPVDVRGSRSQDAVRVEIRNRPRRADRRDEQPRCRPVVARTAAREILPGRERVLDEAAVREERGLGLAIAGDAAREAGGSLAVTRAPEEFSATLELPLGEDGGPESGRAEAVEPRRADGGPSSARDRTGRRS